MTQAILRLGPHVRRRLADNLAAGQLDEPSLLALESALGGDEDLEGILEDLRALQSRGVSGIAAAAWIEALDDALSRQPRPDLVWSGEEVNGLHARDTRSVYEQLLGNASDSLWVSSYTYFDGARAFKVLADRMDAVPSLKVTLLLNIQRKKGDTSTPDDVVQRFADRFWTKDWPGSRSPEVYYDPRSLDLDGPTGVLHAKAVIADRRVLFVTSANLTEAAFDKNVEMGLLARDPALALSAVRHFQVLIERELVRRLPENTGGG